MTINQEVALAKSAIGKTYQWRQSDHSIIRSVQVAVNRDHQKLSSLVNDEIVSNGICVYIIDHLGCTIPFLNKDFKEIEVKPKFVEVKLNGSYSAKVYPTKIEVGCQTFPIDIIDKLNTAHKEILSKQ